MAIYYSYLFSLLFLLLITNLTHSASLRSYLSSFSKESVDRRHPSFVIHNNLSTSEPILIRRRPSLSSSERRKRWSKEEDNDEVEIPIDETIIPELLSTNTNDNESTVLQNDLFSLDSNKKTFEQLHINDIEKNSDENFTTMISIVSEIRYPLLRQDSIEVNDTNELTTISMNDDTSENNKTDDSEQSIENKATTDNILSLTTSHESIDINPTESQTVLTDVTDINQIISNEKNESMTNTIDSLTTIGIISKFFSSHNEDETSLKPISENQTLEQTSIISQVELTTITKSDVDDTSISHSESTTILSGEVNDSQTSIDSVTTIVSEHDTTAIDQSKDTTIIFNGTQNETISIEQGLTTIASISDLPTNDTTEIYETTILSEITDEDEYSNDTISSLSTTTTPKPVCDFSCECSRQCPYGFKVMDDKCQCDPPCKNYQCFGDDVCNVTSEGKPLCQPINGTEHDHPIRCYQPRDEGYHDATIGYHSRWYYEPNQDTCHLFVYRGLGGNENNFKTLHECHLECITCAPAPDRGTCLGHIPMWHYDYKTNECLLFDYSGCKGNENKFIRKQRCIDTCVTRILNI